MKKPFLLYTIVLFAVLSSCVNKTLDRAEADRSMKVLNSDIINLLSKGSERPEVKAFQFLINQPTAPLPYIKHTRPDTIPFRLEDKYGIYQWDDSLSIFEKQSDASDVTLLFPLEDSDCSKGKLIFSAFDSEAYSSRPDFPTLIQATMYAGSQKIVTINHSGQLSDGMPELISSHIIGKDYKVDLSFIRSKNQKKGDLDIELSLEITNYAIIKGKGYAQIEYGKKSFFFKSIKFKLDIFNHRIDANIDYASIDPTSHDYVDSFNQHSQIQVFEMPLRKKVGDIVLDKTDNEELLDYFIRFSNGDQVLLSEYIPLIKRILNMKY